MLDGFKKTEKQILAIALLCCLIFLCLLYDDSLLDFAGNGSQAMPLGQVIEKKHDTRVKYSGTYLWRSLPSSTLVHDNDSVFSGADSNLKIRLKNGSEVLLSENTLVVVKTENNQMSLDFRFGTVKVTAGSVLINGQPTSAQAPEVQKTARPKLQTQPTTLKTLAPPQIVGPLPGYIHALVYDENDRLTTPAHFPLRWSFEFSKMNFDVEIGRDESFASLVSTIQVKGLITESPDLPPGEYFARVRVHQATAKIPLEWSKPVNFSIRKRIDLPVLAPPQLLTKNIQFRPPFTSAPTLKWSEVKGAAQYRLELSSSSDFKNASTYVLKAAHFQWNEYRPGRHYFRVSAATARGTRGPLSEVSSLRVILNRPVLAPVEAKTVRGKSPEDPGGPLNFDVKWSEVPFAASYVIQVCEDASFLNLTQYVSKTNSQIVRVPQPGHYKWRVRAIAENGEILTPFSDLGDIQYTLQLPLATPVLIEPTTNMTLYYQRDMKTAFWLEWKSVAQAEVYKLEISKSDDFSKIVFAKNLQTTRYLLQEKLPHGKLYWRVRAEGTGKYSEWSENRRISIYAGKSARIHNREDEE